ncbi:hypothetical protein [Megalodesulfovibrio paquesii]
MDNAAGRFRELVEVLLREYNGLFPDDSFTPFFDVQDIRPGEKWPDRLRCELRPPWPALRSAAIEEAANR